MMDAELSKDRTVGGLIEGTSSILDEIESKTEQRQKRWPIDEKEVRHWVK